MNYKTILMCAVIGASIQNAWGMQRHPNGAPTQSQPSAPVASQDPQLFEAELLEKMLEIRAALRAALNGLSNDVRDIHESVREIHNDVRDIRESVREIHNDVAGRHDERYAEIVSLKK
jgi:chromosome segregation ATPase